VYDGHHDLEREVLIVFEEIAKSDSSAREVPLAERLIPVAEGRVALRKSGKLLKLTSLAAQVQRARDMVKLPASTPRRSRR
jgi:hypothetical protein